MVIVLDSYMGIFMPEDIGARVSRFMSGDCSFPFIEKDEMIGTFYLFGRDKGVTGYQEAETVLDLARRTVHRSSRHITVLRNMRNKLTSDFIRQEYTKRALQISVEVQNENSFDTSQREKRITMDPTILSACFAQHIAYYDQEYFFELLGPFDENQIPRPLLHKLGGRMLLVAYNTAHGHTLPFQNTLQPFLKWIRKAN
jgi:hypothetical protein